MTAHLFNFTYYIIYHMLVLPLLFICVFSGKISYEQEIYQLRSILADRSLVGSWRLGNENNFMLNSMLTMVNSGQNFEEVQRYNFITGGSSERSAQAFFIATEQGKQPQSLYVQLYDQAEGRNKMVAMQIDLNGIKGHKSSKDSLMVLWENQQRAIFVVCLLMQDNQVLGKFNLQAKIKIQTNLRKNEKLSKESQISISFDSNTFSYFLKLKPITNEYNHFITVQVSSTLLFIVALALLKPSKQQDVYNISQWMIVQSAIFLVLTSCLLLITSLGKLDTPLWMSAVCSILNIGLCIMFLRNYQGLLVRSFKPSDGAFLKGRFKQIMAVIAIIGYFAISSFYWLSLRYWCYECFVLLAMQIDFSYRVGGLGGMSYKLIFTILTMRVPFFYFLINAPQINRVTVSSQLKSIFIVELALLTGFLVLQKIYGSRFILPKELISDYFGYYRRLKKDSPQLEKQCSICLLKLKQIEQKPQDQSKQQQKQKEQDLDQEEDDDDEDFKDVKSSKKNKNKKSKKEQNKLQRQKKKIQQQKKSQMQLSQIKVQVNNKEHLQDTIQFMQTPCNPRNHSFHVSCLKDWMKVRLSCPYCREDLPPLQHQHDVSHCC